MVFGSSFYHIDSPCNQREVVNNVQLWCLYSVVGILSCTAPSLKVPVVRVKPLTSPCSHVMISVDGLPTHCSTFDAFPVSSAFSTCSCWVNCFILEQRGGGTSSTRQTLSRRVSGAYLEIIVRNIMRSIVRLR